MSKQDRVWMKIAWWLPRRLAYWAAVRVMVYNCEGNPTARTGLESLEAWKEALHA